MGVEGVGYLETPRTTPGFEDIVEFYADDLDLVSGGSVRVVDRTLLMYCGH